MSFRTASYVVRTLPRRCLHQTTVRRAITNLEMPAMSPTMTEGGIASWKKKEGESFSAGDVLLEIETDKATIDVEAQDDGVLAKILTSDGTKNVSVGRVIALLAEEGDDICNLEVPKEKPRPAAQKPETSAATPPPSSPPSAPESATEPTAHAQHPTHSKHLMPSVIRLLIEGGVTDAEAIKGTGVRGMLTKGDVLAHLGRASNPLGTYKPPQKETAAPSKAGPPTKPLDGDATRRMIVSSLAAKLKPASHAPSAPASFDSIIADYDRPAHKAHKANPPIASVPPTHKDSTAAYFDGLF